MHLTRTLAILLFGFYSSAISQTFVVVNEQAELDGMADGTAAWVDINQDGHIDLNAGNQIWLNDGDGTFSQMPDTSIAASAVWGDIKNDGYPDAVCWAGPGYMYLNEAGKSLKDISDKLPLCVGQTHASPSRWGTKPVKFEDVPTATQTAAQATRPSASR